MLAGCGSEAGDSPTVKETTSGATLKDLDPLHPVVEIDTSLGKIRVKLDAEKAPVTVRSFLNYTDAGFYANTLIHYVAADQMILGGGYGVDGQPKLAGATVRNEAHNGLKNVRGTIAMARDRSTGIDNATSQFFINLVDSPSFDHRGEEVEEYGYCVFGEVTDGLDVAEAISRASTRDQGGDLTQTPAESVIVRSIEVVE
jgi:cyclophilin family peptidyl-prolyl cis-trans isomerase